MEDTRRTRAPMLQRRFERNRLEEQLWIKAYEVVLPLLRRSVRRSLGEHRAQPSSSAQELVAKRA